MGSIIFSLSTCGSGRRQRFKAARANTFTRVSLRLAPFGDQNALVDDDAGQLTTILDRTDGIAERFPAEGSVAVKLEIARVLDLARDGEVDRVFQQLRVDACLCRRPALPVRARERFAPAPPLAALPARQ